MLGSLIKSFDWKLEDGVKLEDIDMIEKFGITLQKAQPLQVVPIKIRKQYIMHLADDNVLGSPVICHLSFAISSRELFH